MPYEFHFKAFTNKLSRTARWQKNGTQYERPEPFLPERLWPGPMISDVWSLVSVYSSFMTDRISIPRTASTAAASNAGTHP
jgi:hypothetical protein